MAIETTTATSVTPTSSTEMLGLAANGTIVSAAQTNSWPSTIYIGPSTGLATGQTLRLRQLIGWSLADRPSATAVTAQARVAA